MCKRIRGILEGEGVPDIFIPQLIELNAQGRFPFEKLMKSYNLDQINQAVKDSENGGTIKPGLSGLTHRREAVSTPGELFIQGHERIRGVLARSEIPQNAHRWDATRSMPRRRITAKLVRSTIEKSWSRQETPISQAISRSANVTVSIAAIPLRSPSQNRSAALRSSLW